MPELAAHQERVASERVLKLSADLADLAANRVVTPMCPSINIEVARDFVAQFRPIVAAALAACAREAQLEVLHRLPAHAWPDKTTYPQKWGVELRNALQDELLKAMDESALARENANAMQR